MQVNNFTAKYNGLANVLKSPVKCSSKFDPSAPQFDLSNPQNELQAIWDTGATGSVITRKIVDLLNLKPITMVAVTGVHGTKHVPLYKMCIYIPNGVYFDSVHVTEGEIAGGDVLIGMDIISKGDFAVTNKENTTVFSFRIPSLEHIDFTQRVQTSNQPFLATRTPGRNEPCLCGSGKKYKRCCGKN